VRTASPISRIGRAPGMLPDLATMIRGRDLLHRWLARAHPPRNRHGARPAPLSGSGPDASPTKTWIASSLKH
jgi:hypothetical protein